MINTSTRSPPLMHFGYEHLSDFIMWSDNKFENFPSTSVNSPRIFVSSSDKFPKSFRVISDLNFSHFLETSDQLDKRRHFYFPQTSRRFPREFPTFYLRIFSRVPNILFEISQRFIWEFPESSPTSFERISAPVSLSKFAYLSKQFPSFSKNDLFRGQCRSDHIFKHQPKFLKLGSEVGMGWLFLLWEIFSCELGKIWRRKENVAFDDDNKKLGLILHRSGDIGLRIDENVELMVTVCENWNSHARRIELYKVISSVSIQHLLCYSSL